MRYPLRPVQVTELRVEALLSGVLSGDANWYFQGSGVCRLCLGCQSRISFGGLE